MQYTINQNPVWEYDIIYTYLTKKKLNKIRTYQSIIEKQLELLLKQGPKLNVNFNRAYSNLKTAECAAINAIIKVAFKEE